MSPAEQAREHLVAARMALFEADLALSLGEPREAGIKLDLGQAYLAECRKLMATPARVEPEQPRLPL